MKRYLCALIFALALTTVGGAGARVGQPRASENKSAEVDSRLIASVQLPDGGQLRFSQSADGYISLIGALDPKHLPDHAVSYVELYEQVSGAPAPTELIAAQERHKETAKKGSPHGCVGGENQLESGVAA